LAGIIVTSCVALIVYGRDSSWINHAKKVAPGRFSQDQIEGAKEVFALTPFVACTIPFFSAYNVMHSAFIAQGCQMNNNIGSMAIAPSMMGLFNSLSVVVFIPVVDYAFYPFMRKIAGGKFTMTPLRRCGLGYAVSALAMFLSAALEYYRRAAPIVTTTCTAENVALGWCTARQIGYPVAELSSCYQYVGPSASMPVPKHELNLMWQLITTAMIGLSEVFLVVNATNFFYSQVPANMRSVCQAIFLLTISLGTMVGAVINSLCSSWLPNNLDLGHQEYMFFINMFFLIIMLVIFCIIAPKFKYKPGTSLLPGDEPLDETVESTTGTELS